LYERFSFHTNDYKRTIKFAFEYSSQRHARSLRSNDMFFNIVYVRNVNIRVTKIAFANDFRQIIDLRKIKFCYVNVELIASDNI
jgi:hypothetical protein